MDMIGNYSVFWIFGGICLLSYFYMTAFVRETKGLSKQEIEYLYGKSYNTKGKINDPLLNDHENTSTSNATASVYS